MSQNKSLVLYLVKSKCEVYFTGDKGLVSLAGVSETLFEPVSDVYAQESSLNPTTGVYTGEPVYIFSTAMVRTTKLVVCEFTTMSVWNGSPIEGNFWLHKYSFEGVGGGTQDYLIARILIKYPLFFCKFR